jgi:two-component system, sensor histidine kinase and response regulator
LKYKAVGPIRILVVDDDKDDFVLIQDLLREVRSNLYETSWRSSYESGMETLRDGSYDICLLDYRLGAQTGLDFLKEAIALGIKTPIVLLTGFGEHEVDLEAMNQGATDYLVKSEVTTPLLERTLRYAFHRARTQEALREHEAQILMQERLASVGMLASSLAHEIGTPLGVIRGRAEYLSMKLKEDPSVQKNADIIIAQIDRVSSLIRSLLNLARGERAEDVDQVSFTQIATEVIDLMAHEFRKHGIEVQNRLPEAMAVMVSAQSQPLHQVVLNLLVNSVHAIETARKVGRTEGHFIRLEAKAQGRVWEVAFTDSGCGISADNLKKLFTPFFTTKDIGVGTGLGLATTFRILESWGGSIRADSPQGQGAVFTVRLPASGQNVTPVG